MLVVELDFSHLAHTFTKVALGLSKPDPLLMNSLGDTLMTQTNAQIAEGGRPTWAPLKPATTARKQRLGKDNGVLKFTKELLAPANRDVTSAGDTVTLSFAKDYGIYHQLGTKHMQARPLAVADAPMANALADAAADFIEYLARG